MNEKLDTRRILIFLVFAFGLAWIFGLIVYVTGGLVNSPILIPGTVISLATVLLASGYMMAPGLAHVLTRLVTREGWQSLCLRPKLKQGWPYWIAAWFLPVVLTILGGVIFFAIFPQYFDPSLGMLTRLLAQYAPNQALPFDPWVLVVIQTIQAILFAPVINSFFTFGEEFGWRAYLLPKLRPLGGRTAVVVSGIIWGVWHWPVIAMGHNYGLDYPGAPWTGMLAMVWFTLLVGTFLSWVTLRGGSVWPAVIGHAALNGIAGLGALFVMGEPNPLLGPLPTGIIASVGWAVLALWLFVSPKALIMGGQK